MTGEPPVLIYGNGAIAGLAHSFLRRRREIIGFTVDDSVTGGQPLFRDKPLHPFSSVEKTCPPDGCEMLIAVGFRDMNKLRLQKYAEAKAKGYRFTSCIDPGLFWHDDVRIGENSIVLDNATVHPGCRIGHSVFISSNVNLGHDCEIGDGAWLNSGVALGGGCKVGEGAFLGVNACAAHGVSVGDYAFIGANALVDKQAQAGAVLIAPGAEAIRLKSQDFLRFARLA